MTVRELSAALGLPIQAGDESREISGGIYCCDLLSMVMGRAPSGCVWITVMGNLNTMVVAMMAEVACIILAEGNQLEPDSLAKAKEEGLTVLATRKTAYEVCGLMMSAGIAAPAE